MPSDKRARQRAGRQARMAELRRAQKRRRTTRRGAVVAAAVVIVVIAALATGGVFSSGSSKKATKVTTASGGAATLTATAAAALNPVQPPAVSPSCTTPAPASTAPTTTIPAKGNAVATIAAPAGVPFPNLSGSNPHYTKFTAAPPFCLDLTKDYTAIVKTDIGTVTIQLLPADAPVTVNNFVFLAGYHYFDGTVFHRVVKGFVDQGGDPTGTGNGGPGYMFNDELPKSAAAYDNGAVAMANSGANTNGSQFFWIVGNGGAQLGTPAYSMFGQITSGINVMDAINNDGGTGETGTPAKIHRIESVTIEVSNPPAATTTTAAPPTTAPATTAPATTAPATTAPATTAAPSSSQSPATTAKAANG